MSRHQDVWHCRSCGVNLFSEQMRDQHRCPTPPAGSEAGMSGELMTDAAYIRKLEEIAEKQQSRAENAEAERDEARKDLHHAEVDGAIALSRANERTEKARDERDSAREWAKRWKAGAKQWHLRCWSAAHDARMEFRMRKEAVASLTRLETAAAGLVAELEQELKKCERDLPFWEETSSSNSNDFSGWATLVVRLVYTMRDSAASYRSALAGKENGGG